MVKFNNNKVIPLFPAKDKEWMDGSEKFVDNLLKRAEEKKGDNNNG